jgi:hypothetical protein
MKKLIILMLILVILSINSISQVPNRMSYQSVMRNSDGELISNKKVNIKISLLQNTSNGIVVYSELHNRTTNINGLVSLEIGSGEVIFGNFDSVDWSFGSYFLKMETDPNGGMNFKISGSSQLLSVPYAFYSGKSGNQSIGISSTDIKNDSLFITLSNGKINNAGKVSGSNNNIESAEIKNDRLIITLSDGKRFNAGLVNSSRKDLIYLYVEDFGAIANDVNFDNTIAIQKAIDSAIKTGKIIYFDKGNYYVNHTLYIRKYLKAEHDEGIKILGAGVNHTAIISKVANAPLIIIENAYNDGSPIPGYFFQGGYIKNLIFQGTSGCGNCLNITGWWYGQLENIQIRNFGGNAIHMPIRNNFGPPNDGLGNAYTDNYSSFISIKNSKIDNNLGWGYFDEKENTSSDLNCDKTIFASNGLGGIRFGGQSIRLTGCAIAYNGFGSPTGGGLELGVNGNSSHNNFITQIEFDANNQYHIKMNTVYNTTVTSCRFLFHDLIDPTKISPENGAILLAADSKYPSVLNVDITNNFIRLDYPTKAFNKRQNLFFTRFLSHASSYNIKIIDNLFQSLPVGFSNYHDFKRYDYYFDSRLGITNNIVIDDSDPGVYYSSARGKLPPYLDGIVKNTTSNNISSYLNFDFPITYGGYNVLNLDEYIKFYDSTTNLFTIPESGYYDINLGIATSNSSLSGMYYLEYYIDNSIISTHSFPISPNIDNWINDHFSIYCFKGVKLGIKVRSSVPINFSTLEKSKFFLKLLR